jgi:hypothetical protein
MNNPVYWNILTMHGPINVKSSNNISKWQMGFNSAFKGLSWIFRKWDVRTRTELIWLRIGKGVGLL